MSAVNELVITPEFVTNIIAVDLADETTFTTADKAKLNGIEAGAQVNTVTRVAEKTGVVELDAGDIAYDASETYASGKIGAALKSAEEKLDTIEEGAEVNAVNSVNSKSGDVVLNAGDIGYDSSTAYGSGTVGKELSELNRQLSDVEENQIPDLKSALLHSIDPNFMIKMTALGEKIPFRAVAGNVINVKTSSGSNFTVTKLNLYTKNGTTLFDWYGLSSQGSAVRNITLAAGADIYYAQLEGGTVQDIIVTNTSSYFNWKDEVDALTVKDNEFYYTFSRANNIVEVTELGKYIPFYAKAGHYVTVKSRDGSNLTPHDITYYTSAKVKIDDKWLNNVARKSLTFVAPSDIGYIQINGGTAQDVIVTNDSEYMPSTINKLVKLLETIPNYYETQMATKEAEIRGHEDDCGFVGDSLIFITDTHFASDLFTSNNPISYFNANNSFSLIKHIINNTAVRMVCFGGDLVNSTTDIDTMLRCMSVFGSMFEDNKYRLRYCVGNHEYFTGNDYRQTTKPTPGELYGSCPKFNENNYLGKGEMCTYFFDNAVQKIRYFIVSCGRDTELTVNQVKWLLNEFTQVPSGYKVIVIGHAFLSDDLTTFRGYHANICGALDAINAGTSYTFSGTTYDYSGLTDVEVVCVITGHTHIDGSLVTTGGIPCICTTTDSYDRNYELVDGTPTASPRTKGTTDEQAFDIYQFDFADRKIYVTRIGYGADREFSY